MKKNYIGISRDHSGSMSSIARAAMRDYNTNIGVIRDRALAEKQDTIVSVVECGVGIRGSVERAVVNSSVQTLQELRSYSTDGGSTPLWDSVGELIELFEQVPDAKSPDVSFLVMIITDGHENSSVQWSAQRLANKIRELQATDRWSFVFRVPVGMKRHIVNLGIPSGNVLEWETTEHGLEVASRQTQQAIGNYYTARSMGHTSVDSFYTDLTAVKPQTLKAKLIDISDDVTIWTADRDQELIREFCERKSRKSFLKGAAFYQLTKTEKKVQDYKQIVIKDRKSGKVYSGVEARNLLGLPHVGEVKIIPGNHGNYEIFIQSTSVNRKLPRGTQVLYWPKVGTPYTEGVSAPY